jgi:hypothetical protein
VGRCTVELREAADVATLGLSLADAEAVLGWPQSSIVSRQLDAMHAVQRACAACGAARSLKDYHTVRYRSLFGDVSARIARWRACSRARAALLVSC